jgi:protein TonB
MPLILGLLPNSSDGDDTLDTKIVSIKLPQEGRNKRYSTTTTATKVDQVKFVKPVVAKEQRSNRRTT